MKIFKSSSAGYYSFVSMNSSGAHLPTDLAPWMLQREVNLTRLGGVPIGFSTSGSKREIENHGFYLVDAALDLDNGWSACGRMKERKTMIPYIEHKDAIVRILRDRAKHCRTIYYGELGDALGIPARGPWKPVLDLISREETSAGRPDITFLVVSKSTNLPGQIGFESAASPSPSQIKKALGAIHDVFTKYCKSRI